MIIKTAAELLREHNCFSAETGDTQKWVISVEDAEKVMKKYAEQFIDLIPDELEIIEYTELNGDEFHIIDERSILNIKQQIK